MTDKIADMPRYYPTRIPGTSQETPAHIRQAMSKAALLEAGGKRVAVNLPADAVADLERIKERDGLDSKQAIVAALHRHAKR